MIAALCARRWFKPLTVVLCLAALVIVFYPWYWLDIEVYRVGGQAWLDGVNLYGPLPAESRGISFPFTYPPIAAVLFAPLTLLPWPAAAVVHNLVCITLEFLIVWAIVKRMAGLDGRQTGWLAASMTSVITFLSPFTSHFGYGQINIVLMFAVLLDAFVVPPRFRGWLTGAAIAVKLTPAVFVVYYLVKREWRSAVTAIVSTVVVTGIGFAAAWRDSLEYWTSVLWSTGRIGNAATSVNQSITGELARLGASGHAGTAIWLGLTVCLLAYATLLAKRLIDRGYPELAIGAVALFGLLASPVSWEHHWVWVGPLLIVLALLAPSQAPNVRRVLVWLAGGGLVCFLLRPKWAVTSTDDPGTPPWTWHDHIAGNLYLIWAIAFFVAAWWLASRLAPVTATDAPGTRPDHEAATAAA